MPRIPRGRVAGPAYDGSIAGNLICSCALTPYRRQLPKELD